MHANFCRFTKWKNASSTGGSGGHEIGGTWGVQAFSAFCIMHADEK